MVAHIGIIGDAFSDLIGCHFFNVMRVASRKMGKLYAKSTCNIHQDAVIPYIATGNILMKYFILGIWFSNHQLTGGRIILTVTEHNITGFFKSISLNINISITHTIIESIDKLTL